MTQNKLKFTIPKGSLWKVCSELLTEAGYTLGDATRNYRPSINDDAIEIKLLRPQEIPEYLQDGRFDLGISGRDWVSMRGGGLVQPISIESKYARVNNDQILRCII